MKYEISCTIYASGGENQVEVEVTFETEHSEVIWIDIVSPAPLEDEDIRSVIFPAIRKEANQEHFVDLNDKDGYNLIVKEENENPLFV